MFKILVQQTNWSLLGTFFGFVVGFLIKGFLVNTVGLESYGFYIKGYVFITAISTFIAFGFPQIILKFLPIKINSNSKEAISLSSKIVSYIIISGIFSAVAVFLSSSIIAEYLFQSVKMNSILQWSALYLPIILLISIMTALYRSVLKIKEIIIYGTIVSVSLRGILTLIIFQFTDDIEYFIIIESIVQLCVVLLLWFKFAKNHFNIPLTTRISGLFSDTQLMSFAKHVFLGSVITYAGSELLTLIVSVLLPGEKVGAYSLMLTVTGVTIFILINLNKVFAPIISELYHKNKMNELQFIYKKATYLINALTIPFVLLMLFFLEIILGYFGEEMLDYLWLTVFMFLSIGATLPVGSSGVLMNMAGLEKENMYVQLFKSFFSVVLILLFIEKYQLAGVVLVYVCMEYFKNYIQVLIIWKKREIHPFSIDLLILYIIAIPFVIYFISSSFSWSIYEYFIIPSVLFIIYFTFTFKKIKNILLKVYGE